MLMKIVQPNFPERERRKMKKKNIWRW